MVLVKPGFGKRLAFETQIQAHFDRLARLDTQIELRVTATGLSVWDYSRKNIRKRPSGGPEHGFGFLAWGELFQWRA